VIILSGGTLLLAILGVDLVLSGIAGLVAAGAFFYAGASSLCPSCNTCFAYREVSKDKVSRKRGYKTVIRKGEVRNSRGELVQTSERQEQIAIMTVTYEHLDKCQVCGKTRTRTSTEEFENFNE
jgi:hypothetical protein